MPGGCTEHARSGDTKSIYGPGGVYYGWGEIRRGISGACTGYKWVLLHIVNDMPTTIGLLITMYGQPERRGIPLVYTHLPSDFFPAGSSVQSEVYYSGDTLGSATIFGGLRYDITFGTAGHQHEWLTG